MGVSTALPSPRYHRFVHRTFLHPSLSPPLPTNHLFVLMSESSTAQQTSSASSIQLIIDDALSEYTKVTGIDLSNNPFATTLEQSNSPDAILQLLRGRENAFQEYRDGDRRLTSCLTPAVKVLQAFSGIMGQAVSLVSHTSESRRSSNQTSSDSLPTGERVVCWDRCAPCCTSLGFVVNGSPVTCGFSGCHWGHVELRCLAGSV